MKKVIILAPTPPPAGGIAGWTVRMKNASLKNNWIIEVVDEKVIGGRGVFGNTKKNIFIEIKRSFNIWKNLLISLQDKDSKVVHSCIPAGVTGMMREYICAIITKLFGRKFIIHYRCTIPYMVNSKIELFIFKRLTNISDHAIVLNTLSFEFIKKHTNSNVCIIPNFVESSEISKEYKKEIRDRVKTITYVGGVIESKGCSDIIEVAKQFPEIEFRLVGSKGEKIIDTNKPKNVVLLGEKSKSEVSIELDEADIFMFVSYFKGEGFSNALAEAMAKGLPCIVSDWSANKDMIENKGGIIVQPRDINSMINAINKIKDNKYIRINQSKWNIDKVKKNYTEKIITDMYVDIYECVLNNNRTMECECEE